VRYSIHWPDGNRLVWSKSAEIACAESSAAKDGCVTILRSGRWKYRHSKRATVG
jgi:hypothetical protein